MIGGTLGCRKEGFLEEVTQVFTKKNRVGKGSRSRGNANSKKIQSSEAIREDILCEEVVG